MATGFVAMWQSFVWQWVSVFIAMVFTSLQWFRDSGSQVSGYSLAAEKSQLNRHTFDTSDFQRVCVIGVPFGTLHLSGFL